MRSTWFSSLPLARCWGRGRYTGRRPAAKPGVSHGIAQFDACGHGHRASAPPGAASTGLSEFRFGPVEQVQERLVDDVVSGQVDAVPGARDDDEVGVLPDLLGDPA